MAEVSSALDRALSVLRLFTLDAPAWTVEAVATALGVPASTAYRHIASLNAAGLVAATTPGRYTLGPAIIQFDRQIRLTDPFLQAAQLAMASLAAQAPEATLLLCRLFGAHVLCVRQEPRSARVGISYERGRPMPLFRGATSVVILAHLPARQLASLHAAHAAEIAAAGLGVDLAGFSATLAALRRAGHARSEGAVDAGRLGLAAPIFAPSGRAGAARRARRIVGSLSLVLPHATEPARQTPLLAALLAAAQQASRALDQDDPLGAAGPGDAFLAS